ncbi:unnamed protein product, partial [Ixodes persulcatus]
AFISFYLLQLHFPSAAPSRRPRKHYCIPAERCTCEPASHTKVPRRRGREAFSTVSRPQGKREPDTSTFTFEQDQNNETRRPNKLINRNVENCNCTATNARQDTTCREREGI